ncbi:MAG: formylmethanofuran--tetrahydromethanopterin N-formyltransferase, partial [Chloroflexi bacterium]|nr:formylmethanofuran--tetrahydromethanopterin N-formyltransferase [Chloroflexota bacterium]
MALEINGVEIEDTYAEAFKMWGARVIITAKNRKWALEAAGKMTGFATSVIGCRCEAGIEGEIEDTPDGRPGISVLLFTPTKEDLPKRLIERIGQCVMTC